MKSILGRILLLLVFVALLVLGFYVVRRLMITYLEFQSFWHYVVRITAVMAAVFAVILLVRRISARHPVESLGAEPPVAPPFKISNLVKRIVDIGISVVILIVLLPVLVVISLLIFILEGYPIFYISTRYIALDQSISVLKFRTMVRDATSPKYRLKERFMRDGYLDIPLDCEVYTPIGRFLERTQIVELLQLFNVLLHGMSLIGNRPLPRENVMLLRQFDGWEGRFASPAGLSGISQIVGKLNQSPRERLELECLYSSLYRDEATNTLLCDLLITYYTVRLLILGKPLPIEHAKRMMLSASGK
jgi:lipopolysaccharide/colanic/teichoic acid biosynthesis glycosyltransferase